VRPCWSLLVFFGLAAGCANQSEFYSLSANPGGIIDYSEPPTELTGLGGRLAITAEADSWPTLVEKMHPTLTVDNRDLIWVGTDEHGQLQFTLDEAYIYHPPGRPERWVLLKESDDAPFDEFDGEVMGHNLRGVAKLVTQVPEPDEHDIYGEYALAKASDAAHGTVYEIGWQKLTANGTCLCEENRRLYVLQDGQGHWHFLGEGPPAGQGKSGGNQGGGDEVESSVVWTSAKSSNLPVEIHFTIKETRDEWSTSDDEDFHPRPDLVSCVDYVLAGPFPGQVRRTTSHPYVLAEPGDTLDKIAQLNAVWEDDWMKTSAKKFYEQTWRDGLARLNPELAHDAALTPGAKVQLLNQAERDVAHRDYDENIDLLPVVAGESWQGVIFTIEDTNALFAPVLNERFRKFWEPTAADIAQLERDFTAYRAAPENAAAMNRLPALRTNSKDYCRQYTGIMVDGERRILVNGLPRDLKPYGGDGNDWRHGYMQAYVLQLPDSWEIIYIPAQRQFVGFGAISPQAKPARQEAATNSP
jgi:hypothetical protein